MEAREIRDNLNKHVRYDYADYLMMSGMIKKDAHGDVYYLAELIDENCPRSVIYVPLEDVRTITEVTS